MKLRHFDHDGRARFITFSTYHHLPVLSNALFRGIVVDAIDEGRRTFGFRLLAYVVMPDHVHLVIIPPIDSDVGYLVGEIKRLSARSIHTALKGKESDLSANLVVERGGRRRFALWQRRCYDHNCRTDESVWEKVTYCHNNPVRRGLVDDPAKWCWSSYCWYQGHPGSLLEIDCSA